MIGLHDIGRQENEYGGLAQLLGYGLGSGAGALKNRYDQGQQAKQIMQLYGLDQQEAEALAKQPPEIQQQYIQQLQQKRSKGQFADILQAMRGGTPQQGQPGEQQQMVEQGGQRQMGSPLSGQQALEQAYRSGLGTNELKDLQNIISQQDKQRQHEEKQATRKEELSKKDRDRIYKFNKPYVDELYKDYKTAKHEGSVLDQMERLTENGNFSEPLKHNILNAFSLNWDSLLTNDDNTFKKLQNEFLPKMKSLFGGKVSDKEMEQFMKGIPTLTQSPEGRKKLISMLKLMTEVPKVRYKKYKEIAKKYHDYDIRDVVDDQSETKVDAILDKLLDLQGVKRISDEEALEQSQQPQQRGQNGQVSFNPSIFGSNAQQTQQPVFGREQTQEQQPRQRQFRVGDEIESLDELKGIAKDGATIQLSDGTVKKLVNGQWKTIMIK